MLLFRLLLFEFKQGQYMVILNISYIISFPFKHQINSSLSLIFRAHDYLCQFA
uniref:Uncharacterized protein n=1 Tax=Triticum urartu TaxID=4572 RepID=A0A8R7UEP7_TRIUA